MNKKFLFTFVIVLFISFIYFLSINRESNLKEIKREGNTLEVPVDMVTNGAPPESAGGP